MNQITYKILGLPFFLLYINIGVLLLEKEVSQRLWTIVPIVLLSLVLSIDITIRPISKQKDRFNRSISLITFILLPIGVIAPLVEYIYFWESNLILLIQFSLFIIGLGSQILGGTLLIGSRIQLGKYGGPKIVIEENQRLITEGLYKYIRHPMYTGFLLFFLGYSISLLGILTSILITISLFIIFKNRMELEEVLLLQEFPEDYKQYINRTKRLLPFY